MAGAERPDSAAAVNRQIIKPVCATAHHPAFIQPGSPHSKQAR
jgi:hypothetical protein